MRPWKLVDTATVSGEKNEIRLYQRGDEFSIKVGVSELMNSRVHGSEDALAELACKKLGKRPRCRILIGGLGMGFTLAAALKALESDAEVVVAELVPAVIKWNMGPLSIVAEQPLTDKRVSIYEGDVGELIRTKKTYFDAILLDVDNGPEGLTRKDNDGLYSASSLNITLKALRPGGVFGVWSISPDQRFSKRLLQAGFKVDEIRASARGCGRGGRHMIWLGTKK